MRGRRARRGLPLAVKLGGFVSAISLIGAALVGYVGVSTTAARIDSQYSAESRQLLEIITAQSLRHPEHFDKTNAVLENLVATHPALARVRLFRGPPFGPPLVWASSYETDLAIGTDESVLLAPGEEQQSETHLDGLPVFLDVLGVDYPNGVESVAFYYEGVPRTQAIAETRRQILTDSLVVIASQLAAIIIATYLIVLRRVRRLGRAASLVAGGDLTTRVPGPRSDIVKDELDEVAVEFTRMTDAVSLRTRQQGAVADIGRQALATTDLDHLFGYATQTIAAVMGTEYSLLFERSDQGFLLRSAWGVPDGMVGVTTVPDDDRSHAGYTVKTDAPVLVSDRVAETRFAYSEFAKDLGLASGLTVIVRGSAGQIYGVLGADSTRKRDFSQDDVVFLQAVANVLAEAIEREGALVRERAAERRYRLIVENAADLILLTDMDGQILVASPSYGKTLGYPPSDLAGRSVIELVASSDSQQMRSLREAADGKTAAFRASPLKHRDGHEILVDGTTAPIPGPDGSPALILVIAHDVTEQLAAQEERRLLLGRLMAAQEAERLRIAADLHDDPIQTMTAATLRLESVRRLSTDPRQEEMIEKLEDTIGAAIQRLRHLMFELRPPALDREGLGAALRDLLSEASREHGFGFTFESRLEDEPGSATRAIAFRVAKEALVNIIKHAEASRVDVLLTPLDEGIRVRIRDDGVGFDAAHLGPVVGHIGVSSMKERTSLAGGWFRLESSPGEGTTVEFYVPDEPDLLESGPQDHQNFSP